MVRPTERTAQDVEEEYELLAEEEHWERHPRPKIIIEPPPRFGAGDPEARGRVQ